MKAKLLFTRWLTLLMALSTTPALLAETRPIMGPPGPGHARPPIHINLSPSVSASYSPAQIRHAYGFDQLAATGAGQKIAIVDAYGNASIQSDLNTFCNQFGLSSTTVQIVGSNPGSDTGWAMETALDVEWAHAIAPAATIILSVARSSSLGDLLSAVDAAVNAGATVVSMSWGANEFSGMSTYDSHFNRAGVTFTASSGDNGAGVEWPAASPYVVAVGGTSLFLDANYNRTSETAWSGSGGGISKYYARPAFQNGWQTASGRGVPDVSYVADPNTGMLVYDSVNGGWFVVGGTSAGAPQWAALIALGNQVRAQNGSANLSGANNIIYPLAQGSTTTPYTVNPTYFYDVSSGGNGGYTAAAPYDYVTGLGSPVANTLVPALAPVSGSPDFSLSVNPVSATITAGAGATYMVSVASLNGFAGTVTLSATGLPAGATATFNPTSVTGSGSSTLTISTSTSIAAGTYPITISGASGGLTHTTTATLIVQAGTPAADFSLSVSPGSSTIKGGRSTAFTVSITPSGGFADTVSLSVSGLPSSSSYSFSPASIQGSGYSTLTIQTTSATPRGSYNVIVTGTSTAASGSLKHSATVSLRIR